MKELFKSIGGFILGIGFFLAVILFAMFFIKGGVWIGEKVLPWLSIIMWIVLILNILILAPLSILKKTKGFSAIGIYISSYTYGITLWFWGLILTYLIWGPMAVFIGLFLAGIGVVPIAIIATAIEGEWTVVGELIFLILLTYGSRYFGFKLAERADELEYESIFD